jgi:hypothetical protein
MTKGSNSAAATICDLLAKTRDSATCTCSGSCLYGLTLTHLQGVEQNQAKASYLLIFYICSYKV